ncbi:hypothetical protein BH23DEI1_BH23DEI1_13460 [soil metagenome]
MSVARDVDVDVGHILAHQHASGAYPASPSFSQYPHAWLRDGSFVAYAMDRAGEHESAARFHAWVAGTLLRYEREVEALLEGARRGEAPDEFGFLPARFGVDGSWRHDGWPNFQLDGYGHWLWSLGEHRRLAPRPAAGNEVDRAAALVGRYLVTFWHEPCYDAWEEFRSQLHTSTLASIHAGLRALQGDAGSSGDTGVPGAGAAVDEIERVILGECLVSGRFVKHVGNPAVDASLLWLATPFAVLPEGDARVRATVLEIERALVVDGGLTRYAADTFYGGGAWILLTAWLGWYHARAGDTERAGACLAWVEARRGADGALPEQVSTARSIERFVRHWTARWGPSASPLLWSHAMALVLRRELGIPARA